MQSCPQIYSLPLGLFIVFMRIVNAALGCFVIVVGILGMRRPAIL